MLQEHTIQCIHEQVEAITEMNEMNEMSEMNAAMEMKSIEKPIVPLEFTPRQVKALKICKRKAKVFSKNVKPNLFEKFIILGYTKEDFDKTIDFVKKHVPIVVHVNLDKTLDFIINDDHLRNRFETNSSGGSMDIDARSKWEDNLFMSVYKDADPHERVKYGAVNLNCDPDGVKTAHWYGNSYFVMNEDVKMRASFVYNDSSVMDLHMATFKHFCNILYYIPENGLRSIIDVATGKNVDNKLVDYPYIECQLHGPIRFDRDVDMLVVNNCYQNNKPIIKKLDEFSEKTGVSWTFMHPDKLT